MLALGCRRPILPCLVRRPQLHFLTFWVRTTVGIAYQPYTLVQSKEIVSELPAEILALLK